jgi:tetratricopeptide (TPR) repeat protein
MARQFKDRRRHQSSKKLEGRHRVQNTVPLTIPMLRRQRDGSEDSSLAIHAAFQVVAQEPTQTQDWIVLAHLLAKSGRLLEAADWAARVLTLEPDVAGHHRLQASVLERLGRFGPALLAAACALDLHPDDDALAADHRRIKTAYLSAQRQFRDDGTTAVDAAIETAQRLARREPAVVADWIHLTHLLAAAGRLQETVWWATLIAEEEPLVSGHHRSRANALERLGCLKEAWISSLRAVALDPAHSATAVDAERIRCAYFDTQRQLRDDASLSVETAIDIAMQLSHDEPPDINDWEALTRLLTTAGRFSEVLEWLNRILDERPDVASQHRAHDALRRLRDSAGISLETAIETGQRLTNCEIPQIDDWLALAQLFAKGERLDEALDCATIVLGREPDVVNHHRLHASLLERHGRFDEATLAAMRASVLDPDDLALKNDLQRIKANHEIALRDRRDRAGADIDESIKTALALVNAEPVNGDDWMALAQLLARAERLEEALSWMNRILERWPDVTSYQRMHGSVLERLGRFEEAVQSAARAIELNPADELLAADSERVRTRYLEAQRSIRDSHDTTAATSLEAARSLANREPACINDWTALAQILAKADRLDEALCWVDRALETESGVAGYHRLRGNLLERSGRFRKAYSAAKQARLLDPTNIGLDRDVKRIIRRSLTAPFRFWRGRKESVANRPNLIVQE